MLKFDATWKSYSANGLLCWPDLEMVLRLSCISTQWPCTPSTRLLQQQRLLSGLYFIAMALFLRNARLLRNQRLCLQVQQVRDTYPESLKFSLFEDLYAGQDCITTFKLAYWEFGHVPYCKAQLHCENNPSVRYCCYSFLLFQSTCSSKEVSIIYSNFILIWYPIKT